MGTLRFSICRKSVDEVSLVGIEAFRHRIGSDRSPRKIRRNSMDGLSIVGMSLVGMNFAGMSLAGMRLLVCNVYSAGCFIGVCVRVAC